MNTTSTRSLFLRHMMIYKKMIMLLAIIALLAPGFLPHGFLKSNGAVKGNQVSHAKLCCCGNVANECRDCCCADTHTENNNIDGATVTITACGGTSNDIITITKLNYLSPQSAFVQYISVATVAEVATLHLKVVLINPHYKPPKPQLLTNFI